jgi:flagellar protein FliO/FliZ
MTVQRFSAPALLTAVLAVASFCATFPVAAQASTHAHAHHSSTTSFPAEQTPLSFGPTAKATHAASSGGAGGSILRTVLGLFLVIGLIYGIAWAMRRVRKGRDGRASGSGLATAATLPLGGGRSLHLVRAGQDLILVGCSERGVTPIRTYTEAEARASGLLGDEPATDSLGLDTEVAAQWRPAPDATQPQWRSIGDGQSASRGMLETLRRLTVRS